VSCEFATVVGKRIERRAVDQRKGRQSQRIVECVCAAHETAARGHGAGGSLIGETTGETRWLAHDQIGTAP